MSIRPSATLEESLVRLAEKNLSSTQSMILEYIYRNEVGSNHTYSWYVRALAMEIGVPESTAKWCLNNLREMLLIEAGSSLDKGIPLRLTYAGLVVAKGLFREKSGYGQGEIR